MQYRPLEVGSTGAEVTKLQETLMDLGYRIPHTSGKYDSATRSAVLAFQNDNGLPVTGKVDERTWHLITRMMPQMTPEVNDDAPAPGKPVDREPPLVEVTPELEEVPGPGGEHLEWVPELTVTPEPVPVEPIESASEREARAQPVEVSPVMLVEAPSAVPDRPPVLRHPAPSEPPIRPVEASPVMSVEAPLVVRERPPVPERPAPPVPPIIPVEAPLVVQERPPVLERPAPPMPHAPIPATVPLASPIQSASPTAPSLERPPTATVAPIPYEEAPTRREERKGQLPAIPGSQQIKEQALHSGNTSNEYGTHMESLLKQHPAQARPIPEERAPAPSTERVRPRIQWGSRGREAEELQRRLHELGYYSDVINGYFGFGTRAAVIQFQTDRELRADGIVDRDTWWALYEVGPAPRIPDTVRTNEYGGEARHMRELASQVALQERAADDEPVLRDWETGADV